MFKCEIGPNCVFYLVLTFVISKTKEQLQQEKNELSVRHVKLLAPPHPDANNINLIGPPPLSFDGNSDFASCLEEYYSSRVK